MATVKRNDDPAWRNTITALDSLCMLIASDAKAWVDREVWYEAARIRDWMKKYGEEPWQFDEHQGEGKPQ